MTLALKYRPRTFKDTVGQQRVTVILRQMVLKEKVPTALLLTGPRGTGKTTTARILAAALNCTERPADQADPCGQCASCQSIVLGSSTDVIEQDAASNGLVADIRQIRDMCMYAVSSNYRVVLLDEAQSMSREGFNAILKILEEPPPRTIFVLLTTEPGKILETVASRCMGFEFRRITTDDIRQRLEFIAAAEGIPTTPELLEYIAVRADGGLRNAVMSLDQISYVGVSDLALYKQLIGEADYGPAIFQCLIAGDLPGAFGQLDAAMARTGDAAGVAGQLAGLVRELLVSAAGGTSRRELGDLRAGTAELVGVMRVLWDFKTRIRVSDDARTNLEMALVMMFDALLPQRQMATAGTTAPLPAQALSLDQLRAMARQ